jgi:transcription antitermination factor NusG
LPLFPGYVFFRGAGAHRVAALRSNLIVKTLGVPDQRLLSEELSQLRKLQESGASLVPYTPLVPGDAVHVVEGPFKGYTGVVLQGGERPRLVISITMLRKAVAVEFEREALVPMRPPRSDRRNNRSVA